MNIQLKPQFEHYKRPYVQFATRSVSLTASISPKPYYYLQKRIIKPATIIKSNNNR